jgi:hypothetical protein
MRLLLVIGILFLTLSSAIDEPDHAPQLPAHVGRAESSATPVATESSRTRGDRGRIAARRAVDLTLAAAKQVPAAAAKQAPAVRTKKAAPSSPPLPFSDRDAAAAPSQITALAPSPAAPRTRIPAGATSRDQPQLSYDAPEDVVGPDGHTAIYDIAAHTVYLPSGEQLEAHSGLGPMLDDPRYVDVKGSGPTPPNVYDLILRSGLFHGVLAIRLKPLAGSSMFGRNGILAHTYMLGPSGQSFGCISFKDYSQFLDAFLRGAVNRMVVVPHLQSEPLVTSVPQRIVANIAKLAALIESKRS